MKKSITVSSYGVGIGSHDHGCADGPNAIYQSNLFAKLAGLGFSVNENAILTLASGANNYEKIANTCKTLADQTTKALQQGDYFLNFGGDQSGSVGTFSGAYVGNKQQPYGLIWIDAHMDAHTHETSETGNIHGMPLASLLGHGDKNLSSVLTKEPKLLPENVCLMGVRSYEEGEKKLLDSLGVRIFYMDEIKKRGLTTIMGEAANIVESNTSGYCIGLDLDGIDPKDAPGVGTPEPDGISGQALCEMLEEFVQLDQEKFLGVEIVEYNPHQDKNQKTLTLLQKVVLSIFG